MLVGYTFGQVMWSMFVFFAWILFFWLLFTVFADLFRRRDISGWGKAGWTVLVIVFPFLGILIYLIAEGTGMGARNLEQVREQRQTQDAYIRSVTSSNNPSEQIAQGKQLLDSGAITQAEFEQLKARALTA